MHAFFFIVPTHICKYSVSPDTDLCNFSLWSLPMFPLVDEPGRAGMRLYFQVLLSILRERSALAAGGGCIWAAIRNMVCMGYREESGSFFILL